jgi:inner membrane protein involved in colicin E2 resistance
MTSPKIKIGAAVFFILLGTADLIYGILNHDTFSLIVGPVIIFFAANTLRNKNPI